MKLSLAIGLFVGISSLSVQARAENQTTDVEILAQRGKGIVTQDMFAARADKIPAENRQVVLRNTNRVRDLLNGLLLNTQLAAEAREAGFDTEETVINRMKLAAELELAEAWVDHYVATQPAADYEAMAAENYQLNKQEMMTDASIDVSHILVSTKERSAEAALVIAESISQQLKDDPTKFDELVGRYSEDPSAASNAGKFQKVKIGDMVKPFEKAAFALADGEISAPVKTSYGYHIIRLDAHNEAQTMSFDEVKGQLIEKARKTHTDRVRRDYLSSMTAKDVKMTKEALEEMVKRQFGEDYIDAETVDANSE